MAVLTYCGGIPSISKVDKYAVANYPDCVVISAGLFSKKHTIPYSCITNVSLKTDEQISKDVTLTRLFLLGVFAFGAKKKTRQRTSYLVIDYTENEISTSAIFTGDDVPKFHGELLNLRAKYLKKNPSKISTMLSDVQSTSDPYAEIEKLHGLLEKGIVTQEEFDQKKMQLLGLEK